MDILNEKALDKLELYQRLVEVFFAHIPDDRKYEALAEAALVLNYDLNKEF